jgi:hypothetical protein
MKDLIFLLHFEEDSPMPDPDPGGKGGGGDSPGK